MRRDSINRRTRLDKACHCEERSDVAISWKNPGNRTKYQEIATSGFALLAMTWKIGPGPSSVGAEADTPGGVSLRFLL